MRRFADRGEAGRLLAERLVGTPLDAPVVLGLPRGGVAVAAEVAAALGAELDVLVVRKLGVPVQPELAMGAIGEGGVRVLDERVVAAAGVTPSELEQVERRERDEVDRRVGRLRDVRPAVDLRSRTVLVVDDGVATGSTAIAGCRVARARGATRVVLAVPVAPAGWKDDVPREIDEVVCVIEPTDLYAVGVWYDDFRPVTDGEVAALLEPG